MRTKWDILKTAVAVEIALRQIRRTPLNVARMGKGPSDELCQSVKELGVLEPILARKTGEESFSALRGNMRTDAARKAGFITIPAMVVECTDEEAALLVADHGQDPLSILGVAAEVWQLVRLGSSWMSAVRQMGGLISTCFPESPEALAKRAKLKGKELEKALETRDNGRMQSLKGYASPIVTAMIEAGEKVLVKDVRTLGAAYFKDAEAFTSKGAKCPAEGGPYVAAALKAMQDAKDKKADEEAKKEEAEAAVEAAIVEGVKVPAFAVTALQASEMLDALKKGANPADASAVRVLAWILGETV